MLKPFGMALEELQSEMSALQVHNYTSCQIPSPLTVKVQQYFFQWAPLVVLQSLSGFRYRDVVSHFTTPVILSPVILSTIVNCRPQDLPPF